MKLFSKAMAGAALLAAVGGSAQAQTVNVQGNTTGCFYLLLTCGSPTDKPSFTPLLSTGSVSFDGVNSFNWAALAGVPQTVDLGTLKVTGNGTLGLTGYDVNFRLLTTITAPPTVPNAGNYYGDISGNFLSHGPDKLDVDFNNTPLTYVFNGGTLSLMLNDLQFSAPGTQNITGTLLYTAPAVTTTPEPSSMALLGTGLIGLVPMVRRRRNK